MTTNQLTDKIMDELTRLGCSTVSDPCSGLFVTDLNVVAHDDESNSIQIVRAFDDHADLSFNGGQLLTFLQGLESANLDSESPENIWQKLGELEI